MQLIFANPAAAWALLGVPALVLIHFLQRHSKRVVVSTLFLLEKDDLESRSGRRLERWRNSLLFWLQVLAVCLIAWILSAPRWIEADTLQHVAFVMDSSLSLGAFRNDVERGLDRDTATLARGAARTQWLLLESDSTRPPLYRGEDRSALLTALNKWHPDLGEHSAVAALRSARAAVGDTGLVFFVTDHEPNLTDLPVESKALAYGRPLDNLGASSALAEVREGQALWRVLVRNYSAKPLQRSWWLETNGQRSPSQSITIEPGEITAVQGTFPAQVDQVTFVLEPDAFTTDDRAPLVLPKPKSVTLALSGSKDFTKYLEPVTEIIEGGTFATDPNKADAVFLGGGNLTTPPALHTMFFKEVTDESSPTLRAHPAAEPQPLVAGLNFSGLLYQAPVPVALKNGDLPLLWDDLLPLIFLRRDPSGRQTLIFNLDPAHSNLTRLPAFVLLVDRFLEEARRRKPGSERANFLGQQPLFIVLPADAKTAEMEVTSPAGVVTTKLTPAAAARARAPGLPSFFTVRADGKTWLEGSAQFPDPRESDFQKAAAVQLNASAQIAREEAHSHADRYTPLWLLALLGALLASWRETIHH